MAPPSNDDGTPAFGIRPIGIPSTWRRTGHRPLATAATKRWSERLLKLGQVGAGLRAGPEIPPRILQMLLEFDTSACVDSEDCRNAFNELCREAIADTLQKEDYELYCYFLAYYSVACPQLFRLSDGTLLALLKSCYGLVQGDPLAAIIYDIVYTLCVLKPVQEAYPGLLLVALHDDTYLAGHIAVLPEAVDLLTRLAAKVHLEYGDAKRKLLQMAGRCRPASTASTTPLRPATQRRAASRATPRTRSRRSLVG